MEAFRQTAALVILVCLLPLASVMLSSAIAKWLGCTVSGAGPQPCMCYGVDIGGALYTMGGLGYLMMLTLPAAGLVATGWAGYEIFRIVVRLM